MITMAYTTYRHDVYTSCFLLLTWFAIAATHNSWLVRVLPIGQLLFSQQFNNSHLVTNRNQRFPIFVDILISMTNLIPKNPINTGSIVVYFHRAPILNSCFFLARFSVSVTTKSEKARNMWPNMARKYCPSTNARPMCYSVRI